MRLEGFKSPAKDKKLNFGLGMLESAFPYGVFPDSAVQGFLGDEEEDATATNGFLAILLSI